MHIHYVRLYNLRILIKRYFEAWRLIHYPEIYEHANESLATHRTVTIGAIYGICLAGSIRTAEMAISMISHLNPHWRILLWDQMYFQNAIPELNLIYVIITPFCVYFYHRMYFYRNKKNKQIETIWLAYLVLHENGDPRYRDQRSEMYIDCELMRRLTKKNVSWLQYYNLYMGR